MTLTSQPDVPALRVLGLTVAYDRTLAVDRADVELEPDRVYGLVGANGSGKSSFFGAVMGRLPQPPGTVEIFGLPGRSARERSLVAFLPQADGLAADLPWSVAEVVATGRYGRLGPTRRPRAADRQAVGDALHRVGLPELARRPIGELSGGQRKRVLIARAIAQQARLIILDEPFAGVDETATAAISGVLRDLADSGVTILLASHDLDGLVGLCDEVLLWNRRVIRRGEPAEMIKPEALLDVFGLTAGGPTAGERERR
ncbi:metal ABC transporter ATP-binding protein [Microlunatus parietis]|uniref:Manganese transport system ATP-binding protein n=1 Tax=Microlunatus parietis TaxID=682979 RepID=A0A7Y9LC81_9ACTN|nr:metal ABC transporter ATP-binding protein [Microlunatus parietis]NYE74579.1 manganese transport system ATP-binding protein [Microlunatus parietis]